MQTQHTHTHYTHTHTHTHTTYMGHICVAHRHVPYVARTFALCRCIVCTVRVMCIHVLCPCCAGACCVVVFCVGVLYVLLLCIRVMCMCIVCVCCVLLSGEWVYCVYLCCVCVHVCKRVGYMLCVAVFGVTIRCRHHVYYKKFIEFYAKCDQLSQSVQSQ